MPIYKDDNGTYTVRFYAVDPVRETRKQIKKRGFKTKREAVQWESQQVAEQATAKSSATFWEILEKMLDNNDSSEDTRRKKEMWITMYFSDFAVKPIEDISKASLVDWRNGLKSTGLATRTLNNGLRYVRSVFTFYTTVYGGINKGSVLKSFKLTKEDKTEMKIWTPEEFQQFADAIENPVVRAYFTFLFWSGCRRGEGIALTKDCFTGNRVHIYRSMKHFKNGFLPLKTDSSERTITLDEKTMQVLEPWIQAADPFIFGKVHPIGITTISREFKKAIKKSGVSPIRVHDLRHSHASLLLNNGVNIIAVSKRLGHATITQTLETYAHLMRESEDQMLETLRKVHK
jgi:integrase